MLGATVLMVEDEDNVYELGRHYLARSGFQVSRAGTGEEALALAGRLRPDVIVLDVVLPGMDGLEVCRRLQSITQAPILITSALGEVADRVVGLEMGADDYLSKPYDTAELLARVRALLRRRGREHTEPTLRVGALEIDPGSHTATWSGQELHLRPTEFDLLVYLAQRAGRLVSRPELLSRLGYQSNAYERVLDSHVLRVRRALSAAGAPEVLTTIWGRGYRLECEAGD
jgi:DNA-binding response OmpR family regulator